MVQIVWYNGQRGSWDHGLLMSIFGAHSDVFSQHNTKESPVFERAIIIVAGKPEVEPLYKYLGQFKSGLVILTSEEDSFFDWKAAIPAHLEIWTQYYSANKSEIKERVLLGAPNRLAQYNINSHLPKKYLWSFVGQVQNPFRQACVDVLKDIPNGFLHVADSFGGIENGIEYQEYLDIMCQSVFVICPAGSMCVDSFRLYEAIECGAIPITNARAPRDAKDFNYFASVYSDCDLLFMNDNCDDLKNILTQLDQGLSSGHKSANKWYSNYKYSLEKKLLKAARRLQYYGTNKD